MRASYPSEYFPMLTAVSLEVPDGWEPDVAPDTVLCVVDRSSPPHFLTNVIVQVERTTADVPLDLLAAQAAERASAADPTFVVEGEETHEIGGHPAVLRIQTFQPDGVNFPVFQAELLALLPTTNPRSADLVQLHASCAADAAERYGEVFRSIIESVAYQAG